MKVTLDTTDKPERKKRAPKTAFKPGNPYAFKPGESGRSRAKKPTAPDDVRLVSKALRARLPFRAPDAIALKLGLEAGASWAQCIAQSLMFTAVRGDVAGIRAVHELTEGMLRQRLGLGFDTGDEGDGENAAGPRLTVQFVTARFQGSGDSGQAKSFVTDDSGVTRVYEGDRLVEIQKPRLPAPPQDIDEAPKPAPAPQPEAAPSPSPAPTKETMAALARPRPATKPESAQETRSRIYKRLGY